MRTSRGTDEIGDRSVGTLKKGESTLSPPFASSFLLSSLFSLLSSLFTLHSSLFTLLSFSPSFLFSSLLHRHARTPRSPIPSRTHSPFHSAHARSSPTPTSVISFPLPCIAPPSYLQISPTNVLLRIARPSLDLDPIHTQPLHPHTIHIHIHT